MRILPIAKVKERLIEYVDSVPSRMTKSQSPEMALPSRC